MPFVTYLPLNNPSYDDPYCGFGVKETAICGAAWEVIGKGEMGTFLRQREKCRAEIRESRTETFQRSDELQSWTSLDNLPHQPACKNSSVARTIFYYIQNCARLQCAS